MINASDVTIARDEGNSGCFSPIYFHHFHSEFFPVVPSSTAQRKQARIPAFSLYFLFIIWQARPLSNAGSAVLGTQKPCLARELRLFDATMVVMGGIVGSGIFINPSLVARQVHTPVFILAAWIFGGLIAICGAFIWAELAATLPKAGGQYVYLREAYHPAVAFLYGWVLLLVIETGGMAAVTITFARYFIELTGMQQPSRLVGAVALAVLTLINCLGVKIGGAPRAH